MCTLCLKNRTPIELELLELFENVTARGPVFQTQCICCMPGLGFRLWWISGGSAGQLVVKQIHNTSTQVEFMFQAQPLDRLGYSCGISRTGRFACDGVKAHAADAA